MGKEVRRYLYDLCQKWFPFSKRCRARDALHRSGSVATTKSRLGEDMSRAHIIAGLAYGDEGKGTMVDFLCRVHDVKLVVRYNGGPQAGHNVVLPDGRHHSFSQFGAGTFIPDVLTHLSKYMIVEPFAMMNEREALEKVGVSNSLERVSVDPECVVITPWHWMLNRIREIARGSARHGSCGFGIGEARADQIAGTGLVVGDIPADNLAEKLNLIRHDKCRESHRILGEVLDKSTAKLVIDLCVKMMNEKTYALISFYRDWYDRIRVQSELPSAPGDIVFEGAQGVLLDEIHGFQPYTTWTNTTFDNALKLLDGTKYEAVRIGVLRSYMTRHGAGPFVSETTNINLEDHNVDGPWQGRLRFGYFDAVAARYAIRVCGGIDTLAITHLDQIYAPWHPESFMAVDEYSYKPYEESGERLEIADIPDVVDGCADIVDRSAEMREGLTNCLMEFGPVVRSIHGSPEEWIQDALGVPVSYTSKSPTFEGKCYEVKCGDFSKSER
jgi:adenylosuccinate synthase